MADAVRVKKRPLRKRLVMVLRRGHLYFGLFLFPWAILYGVTGFLFNHPSVMADAPPVGYDAASFAGTPLATPPIPAELAAAVVDALNSRAPAGSTYALVDPEAATWNRDFAFATVKTADGQTSILYDMFAEAGNVRPAVAKVEKVAAEAPFALGQVSADKPAKPAKKGTDSKAHSHSDDRLSLASPMHERFKDSIPAILAHHNLASGEVTVTSVPDLRFRMKDRDDKVWTVTYAAMTGSVSGTPAGDAPTETISTRRFLTRMHLAHGYPSSGGPRWWWAVIVDLMAGIMVFWALTGLVMWWAIGATRRTGFAVLVLSGIAAGLLATGMHRAIGG